MDGPILASGEFFVPSNENEHRIELLWCAEVRTMMILLTKETLKATVRTTKTHVFYLLT